jgi:hypothetical protein
VQLKNSTAQLVNRRRVFAALLQDRFMQPPGCSASSLPDRELSALRATSQSGISSE